MCFTCSIVVIFFAALGVLAVIWPFSNFFLMCSSSATNFFKRNQREQFSFKNFQRASNSLIDKLFGRYPHRTKAFCCSRNKHKPYQGASKGAFAAYPRFNKWAAVFHDHLDCLPASLSSANAEQPATPHPSGIRMPRLKKRK